MAEVRESLAAMVEGFNADLPHDALEYTVHLSDQGFVSKCGAMRGGDLDQEALADFFEELRDEIIEHVVGGIWPRCPLHGSHPLRPTGEAWTCPAGGRWVYGSLAQYPPPPEPAARDGDVTWYSAERGWGIIAHRDGDLFVHFSAIDMPGHRVLVEGQRVEYRVSKGSQGKFRRADWVRPLESSGPAA